MSIKAFDLISRVARSRGYGGLTQHCSKPVSSPTKHRNCQSIIISRSNMQTRSKTTTTMQSYSDDLPGWIRSTPVPDKEKAFFEETEWTKAYVNNTLFQPILTPARIRDQTGGSGNAFFANTTSNPSGISHWLTLMRKDFTTPPESTDGSIRLTEAPNKAVAHPTDKTDCLSLIRIGPGLDGFAGTTHGGVVSAILDEALSLCVELHRQLTTHDRAPLFTARLNMTFRAPVQSPGLVVVKTWLEKRQGRKWLLSGQICDADDRVLNEAQGLWISAREKL